MTTEEFRASIAKYVIKAEPVDLSDIDKKIIIEIQERKIPQGGRDYATRVIYEYIIAKARRTWLSSRYDRVEDMTPFKKKLPVSIQKNQIVWGESTEGINLQVSEFIQKPLSYQQLLTYYYRDYGKEYGCDVVHGKEIFPCLQTKMPNGPGIETFANLRSAIAWNLAFNTMIFEKGINDDDIEGVNPDFCVMWAPKPESWTLGHDSNRPTNDVAFWFIADRIHYLIDY